MTQQHHGAARPVSAGGAAPHAVARLRRRTRADLYAVVLGASLKFQTPCATFDGTDWTTEDDAAAWALVVRCDPCPVRRSCYEYAMLGDEVGVWGGTTGGTRAKIRRARRDGRAA